MELIATTAAFDYFSLFAVGTIWFWLLLAAVNIFIITCVEWDWGGWATVAFIATLLVLNFFGQVPIFTYMLENPITIIFGILGYFVTGTAWCFAKWWLFVKDQRRKFDEVRDAFLKKRGIKELSQLPLTQKSEWESEINTYLGRRWLDRTKQDGKILIRPDVSNHKQLIYVWIAYWPWSALWTLINDPIRRIVRNIYNHIKDTLQRISDSIFEGTELEEVKMEAIIRDKK